LKENAPSRPPDPLTRGDHPTQAFSSDEGCSYDTEISIDISELNPMVTWGTNPEQGIQIDHTVPFLKEIPKNHRNTYQKAMEYTRVKEGDKLEGLSIDWAFLGSCTNGRIEDLRIASEILKGKKIDNSVTMYVVPGSEVVKAKAEEEGLDKIFLDAGADWRMPGCSLCLGMNDDKVPSEKRCISTSNRNFVGRQGTGSITHLASPATVVTSAINGVITNPIPYLPS